MTPTSAPDVPVLWLHGFLGVAEDLRPLADAIEGRTSLLPDLPGHGNATPPLGGRGNAFIRIVDEMVATLQHRGIPRFDVVGYSMGGRIAYGILCRHPEHVRRAVTIGASPGLESAPERTSRAAADRALAARLESDDFDRFLGDWYDMPLFAGLREHPEFETILARRRRGHPRALASALVAMSTGVQPALWSELEVTCVPILAIAGGDDEKYTTINETLARRAPRVRALVVPGAGHVVHVEKPGPAVEAIGTFLNEEEDDRHGGD